jgi:hypothetical protein
MNRAAQAPDDGREEAEEKRSSAEKWKGWMACSILRVSLCSSAAFAI